MIYMYKQLCHFLHFMAIADTGDYYQICNL